MDESVDFVAVYTTVSPIAAQKVINVILVPEGIRAQTHDRRDMVIPSVGGSGAIFIEVAQDQVEKATALIEEAQANGFLDPEEGERI